jgi:AraC-like DNA-binding protein
MLSGPWLEPFVVPVSPGSRYVGFRCRPDTGGIVAGTDPALLRNRSQSAHARLGDLAGSLVTAVVGRDSLVDIAPVFDRLLLEHVRALPPPEPVARAAVSHIWYSQGGAPITAVAAATGVSSRTLLRRFRRATGMTPKQYARIARFWHAAIAATRVPRMPWSRVALEAGYADQSHLTNEFTELTGLSPCGLQERVSATTYDWAGGGFPQDRRGDVQ